MKHSIFIISILLAHITLYSSQQHQALTGYSRHGTAFYTHNGTRYYTPEYQHPPPYNVIHYSHPPGHPNRRQTIFKLVPIYLLQTNEHFSIQDLEEAVMTSSDAELQAITKNPIISPYARESIIANFRFYIANEQFASTALSQQQHY